MLKTETLFFEATASSCDMMMASCAGVIDLNFDKKDFVWSSLTSNLAMTSSGTLILSNVKAMPSFSASTLSKKSSSLIAEIFSKS